MNPDWYLAQVIASLIAALPWLVGALGTVAVVSWSPLGRALLRHLKGRRQEAEVAEALLQEIGDLRALLGETLERLDATERRLAQLPSGPAHVPLPAPPREAPLNTPH